MMGGRTEMGAAETETQSCTCLGASGCSDSGGLGCSPHWAGHRLVHTEAEPMDRGGEAVQRVAAAQ